MRQFQKQIKNATPTHPHALTLTVKGRGRGILAQSELARVLGRLRVGGRHPLQLQHIRVRVRRGARTKQHGALGVGEQAGLYA